MTRTLRTLALVALFAAWPAVATAAVRTPARSSAHAHVRAAHAAAAPAAGANAAARPGGAARTLDDIHIEGEIPVPQVLFITARDQRRFVEFQPRRYLRTSRQLAEATLPPDWIVVTRTPITPNQETPR